MALNDATDFLMSAGNLYALSGARANVSLNTAYVHNTSGNAVGIRYMARTVDPIDELYLMLDTNIGTLGNITMACDIYNEHASVSTQAGTTLRDSSTATAMPNAADKWIKFTFGTPYTPTVGEILWFVAYNTSGAPATDAPGIMTSSNDNNMPNSYPASTCYSTTAGFTTTGTGQHGTPHVIKQGSRYLGKCVTQANVGHGTTALRHGLRIVPPVTVKVSGMMFSIVGGSTSFTGIEVYDDVTAPGGTPIITYALGSDANESRDELLGKVFDTPLQLTGGTAYKIVLTCSGSTSSPLGGGNVEDYATYSSVFDAMIDGFSNCAGVIDDGAGGWTINNALRPGMYFPISEFVTGIVDTDRAATLINGALIQ